MATASNRVPTDEEKAILRRNGIDPTGVAVKYSDEDTLHILKHATRDDIVIHRGEKKWY